MLSLANATTFEGVSRARSTTAKRNCSRANSGRPQGNKRKRNCLLVVASSSLLSTVHRWIITTHRNTHPSRHAVTLPLPS